MLAVPKDLSSDSFQAAAPYNMDAEALAQMQKQLLTALDLVQGYRDGQF